MRQAGKGLQAGFCAEMETIVKNARLPRHGGYFGVSQPRFFRDVTEIPVLMASFD
jgi:hypothetical protein